MTGRNAMRGYPGHVTTSVAKHGLLGLTKTLSREFGPQGITVNAVSPGVIDTRDDPAFRRAGAEGRARRKFRCGGSVHLPKSPQ